MLSTRSARKQMRNKPEQKSEPTKGGIKQRKRLFGRAVTRSPPTRGPHRVKQKWCLIINKFDQNDEISGDTFPIQHIRWTPINHSHEFQFVNIKNNKLNPNHEWFLIIKQRAYATKSGFDNLSMVELVSPKGKYHCVVWGMLDDVKRNMLSPLFGTDYKFLLEENKLYLLYQNCVHFWRDKDLRSNLRVLPMSGPVPVRHKWAEMVVGRDHKEDQLEFEIYPVQYAKFIAPNGGSFVVFKEFRNYKNRNQWNLVINKENYSPTLPNLKRMDLVFQSKKC